MSDTLSMLALVGHDDVRWCRCFVCGRAFDADVAVPALCAEAEVIGTVCASCLSPAARAIRPRASEPVGRCGRRLHSCGRRGRGDG
jgi:hypothetical protein